jgi:DNA replication and repair protein RecF
MILQHLSLTNFRAFSRLDVDVPGGIVLLHGENAQGKTSLLEAVYFLATFTSFLTSQDSQVIHFLAKEETIPVARIVADITDQGRIYRVEIRIILQPQEGTGSTYRLRKEILVDGIKKSASQVIGLFRAVVFIPQMTRLVENGPDERRKYMNLVFCQVIPGYAHHLTQYTQALTRRNALLKQIAEKGGNLEQLDYWDDLLLTHGKGLMDGRQAAIQALNLSSQPIHLKLSAGKENLVLEYLPSIALETNKASGTIDLDELRKRLRANHRLDIQRGVTTLGAHRDDFRFLINNLDLSNYGSRGQIRTALQALKLGEVEWMRSSTGSSPVLLLDETLAELDEFRRKDLLTALGQVEQALLTTADLELFHQGFLDQITRWEIEAGQIREWASSPAAPPDADTTPD